MWRSIHKKRKRGALPTTVEKVSSHGGVKTYPAVWPFKKSVNHDYAGNSGHKGKHRRPIQPPGYPSGKCLGAGHEGVCRCGTHNRRAA